MIGRAAIEQEFYLDVGYGGAGCVDDGSRDGCLLAQGEMRQNEREDEPDCFGHTEYVTAHTILTIATKGKGLYSFTQQVSDWLRKQTVRHGSLLLFAQHTSCSLVIQENADPDVIRDINEFFKHLVKENAPFYRHQSEGPDDMPSHIRSVLTATSISIPVVDGRLVLGTWQGIYVFEHRAHPHRRSVVLHLAGDAK